MNAVDKMDNKDYIELKNFAYYIYDVYHKASPEKGEALYNSALNKYSSDIERQIFSNTIKCPYDVELYTFMSSNTLSDETIKKATTEFNVTSDIVKEKTAEYLKYDYIECVNKGLIDQERLLDLKEEYNKNAK